MVLENVKVGVALTGSFCTYDKIYEELKHLVNEGAHVTTIFSNISQTCDSRFGNAIDFLADAKSITGHEPITNIVAAEPIGPKKYFDILTIAPCTGNTLAKLVNGITDSPVLMAAKSHLRNNRPLLISLSTNDALGMNLKNIGGLINVKHIYFVPFGQDNHNDKPNSMVAHTDLIIPSILSALKGEQIQPIIKSPML